MEPQSHQGKWVVENSWIAEQESLRNGGKVPKVELVVELCRSWVQLFVRCNFLEHDGSRRHNPCD